MVAFNRLTEAICELLNRLRTSVAVEVVTGKE